MRFGDLIDDTFRMFEEVSSSPVHFTEEDVKEALNCALEEVSDGTEFFEQNAVLNVRPLATYHDLRNIGQYEWLRITSIWSGTRNIWLNPIDVKDLDLMSRQWELSTGEPDRWFMRGLWWLGVYPITTSQDRVLRVYGKAVHPRLNSREDVTMQLPEEFRLSLVDYALFDLLSKDGETTNAIESYQDYVKEENLLRIRAAGRITKDRIPVLGQPL